MSGTSERRARDPHGWFPPSACSTAGARAAILLAVVVAVVAGLLAMHALTSAQLGISGNRHADGHVHTDDHHGREDADATAPGVSPQAPSVAAARPATTGWDTPARARSGAFSPGQTRVDVVSPTAACAMPCAAPDPRPAQPDTLVVTAIAPALAQSPQTGHGHVDHGLCPGATPGHCPHLPALMSLCQAILSGAGVVLLLLLLLALAVQRTAWTIRLVLRSLSCAPHGEWSIWRSHLRVDGPSLHELCISRT